MSGPREFIEALHGDLDGYIDVRLIEDRRGGAVVERQWYESPDDLVADLPRLQKKAAAASAAVFFGVLPRRARGAGKAADVLPGLVAWVDIDFKDFAGGEPAARERLEGFPRPPSIVVHSGHGLHCYWLMREPTEPDELSRLSKGLAQALGGDHAFDAARILRMPGTMNRKDPENPVPVVIETLDAERVYNPSEIEEALDMVGAAPGAVSTPTANPEVEIGQGNSRRVLALLDSNASIRRLFEGKGKPEVGPDGKTLDTSSSGYDFSLAFALAKAGVTERDELATAVGLRPDGAARVKGPTYIAKTVAAALERAQEAHSVRLDFHVEHVRVFVTDKPIFELTIEGQVLRLSGPELRKKTSFQDRFLAAFRRIPSVPGKTADWEAVVNGWLDGAEEVELPEEASDEAALKSAITAAIEALSIGDDVCDLDRGQAIKLDEERVAFKADHMLMELKATFLGLQRPELCRQLRELGYDTKSRTVGGVSFRAWAVTE